MRRATRSLSFSVIYSILLLVVMGPVQWLAIRPLRALMPSRRNAIMRGWLRLHAQMVLGLARTLGGLRLDVHGALPETSCIVLMNHQSLLDIPVGVWMMNGPCPVIPTRAKYSRGIPVISGLVKMGGFPSLSQGAHATRAEHQAMVAAAEAVGRGERSFLIFPEGHRSPTGEILPFMTSGLRMLFRRAHRRPVYLLLVDGLWRLRSLADIALRLAGSVATVQVLGPYEIPPDHGHHEDFVAALRETMLTTLERMRDPGTADTPLASSVQRAG